MTKSKPEIQTADQAQRFKETARALGCDEDEAAFDEKLRAVARQKPKADTAGAAPKPVPPRGRRGQG
jgi:SET domain-containing protein